MPWIARDKTGDNPYRIFGLKPKLLTLVSYDGDVMPNQATWSIPQQPRGLPRHFRGGDTYGPTSNTENTLLDEKDCPVHLEPGEGPIEVKIVLINEIPPRNFEGAGI